MSGHNPAFPVNTQASQEIGSYQPDPGMSLRDYFAARALNGIISAFFAMETHHGWTNDEIAKEAYSLADSMTKAREAA